MRARGRTALTAVLLLGLLGAVPGAFAVRDSHAAFSGESGQIGFIRSGSLYAVAPDGSGTRLIRRGVLAAAFSPDGTQIAFARASGIAVMKADGSGVRTVTKAPRAYADSEPAWSPNGRFVAFTRLVHGQRYRDLYRVAVATRGLMRLTRTSTIAESHPAWSPDGKTIVVAGRQTAARGRPTNLFMLRADGTRRHRLSLTRGAQPAFSPDGGTIVFSAPAGNRRDIRVMSAAGRNVRNLTRGLSGTHTYPTWSPDGTQIVFASTSGNRAGVFDLWLIKSDGTDPRRLTKFGMSGGKVSATRPDWQVRPTAAGVKLTKNVFAFYTAFGPREKKWPWNSLTHVSIFAARLHVQGGSATIQNTDFWRSPEVDSIRTAAHANGVKVLLTITNFEGGKFSGTLAQAVTATADVRRSAVNAIVQEALVAGHADGVTIDFEKFRPEDAANVTAFVAELARAVHAAKAGAEVYVAVGARNTKDKFDVKALAAAADGLFLMTYVYHSEQSGPGPVSPLTDGGPWAGSGSITKTVDRYIADGAPARKLIPAISLAGHDWPATSPDPGAKRAKGKGKVKGVPYDEFRRLYLSKTYERRWDAASQTPYLAYQKDGTWHQIWAEDEVSIGLKLDFIKQKQLWGFGIWGFSREDDSLPAVIRSKLAVTS